MKKTRWFSGDVKPVRKGVYEREPIFARWLFGGRPEFSYWNGKHWCSQETSPIEASNWRICRSGRQGILWRGLAQETRK